MSGPQSAAEALGGPPLARKPLQAVCDATVGAERASQRSRVTPSHTCSGCEATWTAANTCHCSGCHASFAGVGLFDKHRAQYGEHGVCRRPADLTTTSGEPVMFFRDGIWKGPQMTEEDKLVRFGRKS